MDNTFNYAKYLCIIYVNVTMHDEELRRSCSVLLCRIVNGIHLFIQGKCMQLQHMIGHFVMN